MRHLTSFAVRQSVRLPTGIRAKYFSRAQRKKQLLVLVPAKFISKLVPQDATKKKSNVVLHMSILMKSYGRRINRLNLIEIDNTLRNLVSWTVERPENPGFDHPIETWWIARL